MKNISEIMKLEQSIASMLTDLTAQIKKATAESNMDGVKSVAKNAAIVSVSSLDSGILCPYYYLQSTQADIVEQHLRSAKTASEFVDRMKNMVETKKVKLRSETYRLNSKTVEIINSYLEAI